MASRFTILATGFGNRLSHAVAFTSCRHRRAARPGKLWPVLLLVVAMLPLRAAAEEESRSELPFESKRYRTLIWVAFSDDPTLTLQFRRGVLDEIGRNCDRTFYRMWDRRIEENSGRSPMNNASLRRLTASEALEGFREDEHDKVFFTTVEIVGSQYTISVREWDTTTQLLGPVLQQRTPVRSRVAEAAIRGIAGAFRPILAIEAVDGTTATLRLQASAFPPSDPAAAQLRPGDVLQACLRYRDLDGVVARIQLLPWTHLVVEDIEAERVTCTVASGLRAPLGGGRRRRVESVAIATRAAYDSTRLQLRLRSNRKQALIGHQVRVVSKLLPERESPQPGELLVSDRRGTVLLPSTGGKLVWLYVHSGDSLLARVPYIPGSDPNATLVVPDDSIRLSVEGELELLQGDLVDLVAKRAQHILRARKLAAADEWKLVEEQLALLDDLPDIAEFERRLSTIRVPALEAARKDNNRLAESRISKLCDQMTQLIGRYVDDDKMQAARERLEELRPESEGGGSK